MKFHSEPMTTIAAAQRQIDGLIRVVNADLGGRGILLVSRADLLLSAVKHARQEMRLCEQVTPPDYFTPRWKQQSDELAKLEVRLSRIIRGTRIPDDHEAESPQQIPHHES